MTVIMLSSVTDWDGFSHAVRYFHAEGVSPADVGWHAGPPGGSADLFDTACPMPAAALPSAPALRLPRAFVEAAREVFLHADPQRLPLLHRLAVRIAADSGAWADALHADRLQFERWQREVRRDIHKTHAFVRFRQIVEFEATEATATAVAAEAHESPEGPEFRARSGACDPPASAAAAALRPLPTLTDPTGSRVAPRVRHVAWFEPEHHTLEAAAPFFARRFATLRWAILTPRASVRWEGRTLVFGPGAQRADAPPADAGEALWLDYYRSIFNPARVKVAMMKKEMPVHFWKNLPEAAEIGPLLRDAPARQRDMIARGVAAAADAHVVTCTGTGPGPSPITGPGAPTSFPRNRRRARLDPHRAPLADAAAPPLHALDALRRQAAGCRGCALADPATQTVFGEGLATARLMLVGEQPGDHEDLCGRPFQGPAGQLLRAAFDTLGWDQRALYLTNAVKHFGHALRGRRRLHKTPGQQEAEACLHWLEAEIAALRPAAIVALGATAARSLLGRAVPVQAEAGRWSTRADGIPVLVCLHPAAILRAEPLSRSASGAQGQVSALRTHWIETLGRASPFLAQPPFAPGDALHGQSPLPDPESAPRAGPARPAPRGG